MPRQRIIEAVLILVLLPLLLGAAQIQSAGTNAQIPAWDLQGTRYFGLSAVCDALGIGLTQNAKTLRCSLAFGTSRLVLAPGMNTMLLDGAVHELDNPPRLVQGRLAVPLEVLFALEELTGSPIKVVSFESDPRIDIDEVRNALKPAAIARVMLDPGHGGEDPGAIGPQGQLEKDVTLAVAMLAKTQIERELGCEVMLSRGTDVFVPLSQRTKMANLWGADLFVSIHANGSRRAGAAGIETFYLAMTASDADAAAVAADENAVLQLEGGPSPEALDDLRAILWDMVRTEVLQASAEVAEIVQIRLAEISPTPNRGVKQAPFFVLIGTQMPAILIEVGFITNPDEAERICDTLVQLEIAKAIACAVADYDAKLRGVNP